MPKITVITPVYNVEEYLDRCVESILAQSFTDFELILVDDGSLDNCPQMCDDWEKRDDRIRVIHQENRGQAVARNRAIDIALGEYIGFVDSDDYVHPCYLEMMYANITNANADISVCRYKQVVTSNDNETNLDGEVRVFDGADYVTKILLREIVGGAWLLCDKLFSRKCFDIMRIPEGRIYEDNAIAYKLLYESKTVVDCDMVLYYYFTNPNSTVTKRFNKKHLDLLLVPEEMIEYFTKKNIPELIDMSNAMYLNTLADLLVKTRAYLNDKNLEKELHLKLFRQYKLEKKKNYIISIKTHPQVFDALYPKCMRLYWATKAMLDKIKCKRS